MKHDKRQHLAWHVAAHAVAEARYGDPFERVAILDGKPVWLDREDSLEWKTSERAEQVILRLAVGLAVANIHGMSASDADYLQQDRLRLREQLQKLNPNDPVEELETKSLKRATTFLQESANERAMKLIADDLQRYGWLRMEEVDFLIDAAEGDPDALDDLERFRKLYDVIPVTWPDET